MRSNLKPLESFTLEDGVHARPLSTRKQLWPADSHCVEISKAMQHIYGTTGSNRSWKGEESPVSVIGHAARSNNMNIMQVAASCQPSSGSCTSSNMEHPPAANGFSPDPPPPPANNSSSASNCPLNQYNHALIISNDPPANSNSPESASKYAELLSERVHQAFRKSHELTPPVKQVKTWPVSTTSKRMEWLNLPEEPPAFINASELSKVFHSLKGRSTASNSAAAPAGSTTNVSTRVLDDQASSEEDGLSMTYSSSRKDYEEDEEDNSVIDFFPAINRRAVDTQSRRGSKGRHNEKLRMEDCSSNELGTDTRAGPGAFIMTMRRSSACRAHAGAAGAAGGLRLPISHHDLAAAENHAVDEEEGSRVSTSYKWDDAERWLTASPTTSTSGRSAPAAVLAAGRLHPIGINNRDGSVKAAHYPQLVQVHTRKPLCDPASTQDKHVAQGRGSALDGVDMREAATEFDKQRKKDMATQSTPAEWSSCDSPDEERAILTDLSSATADHLVKHSPRHAGAVEYNKYSTGHVDKEAPCTQIRTSPPRHNTPARRSVSCNQQRGSRYIVPSDCVLSIYSSTSGKLNLRELESCHLDKLKLARDIPLGTSETWQLFAEEEDGMDSSSDQKYLLERKSPAATSQHVHHLSKVNMLEARVSAWEDVERAKHLAKFKRDEAKIEAWESLQRAEAEAELRKLEVKLEKMRFEGREKIMGKLGAAQKRVQEMRRVVEVQKAEQLTRVAMRANHIRKSGNFPSSAFNVMCSLTTKIKPSSNLSFS